MKATHEDILQYIVEGFLLTVFSSTRVVEVTLTAVREAEESSLPTWLFDNDTIWIFNSRGPIGRRFMDGDQIKQHLKLSYGWEETTRRIEKPLKPQLKIIK